MLFLLFSSLNTGQDRIPSKATLKLRLKRRQQPSENQHPGRRPGAPLVLLGPSPLSQLFSASLEWILSKKGCSTEKPSKAVPARVLAGEAERELRGPHTGQRHLQPRGACLRAALHGWTALGERVAPLPLYSFSPVDPPGVAELTCVCKPSPQTSQLYLPFPGWRSSWLSNSFAHSSRFWTAGCDSPKPGFASRRLLHSCRRQGRDRQPLTRGRTRAICDCSREGGTGPRYRGPGTFQV